MLPLGKVSCIRIWGIAMEHYRVQTDTMNRLGPRYRRESLGICRGRPQSYARCSKCQIDVCLCHRRDCMKLHMIPHYDYPRICAIWAVYQFVIALVSPVIATESKVFNSLTAPSPSLTSRPTHLPCFFAAETILSIASTKTGSSPRAGV
jgi:hypothetical protein